MSMELILRLYLIGGGICIIVRILMALADRRLVEAYSVPWMVLAVGLIITGCVIQPKDIEHYFGWPFFIFLLICGALVIGEFFHITEHQSDMLRRILELSMQVSLLNEENSRISQKREQKCSQEKENNEADCFKD